MEQEPFASSELASSTSPSSPMSKESSSSSSAMSWVETADLTFRSSGLKLNSWFSKVNSRTWIFSGTVLVKLEYKLLPLAKKGCDKFQSSWLSYSIESPIDFLDDLAKKGCDTCQSSCDSSSIEKRPDFISLPKIGFSRTKLLAEVPLF